MFSAFLPFFKRSHSEASAEKPITDVAQLRSAIAETMQAMASDPSATAGMHAEILTDSSSWKDSNAEDGRPAKYATFAALVAQAAGTAAAADEFTLTLPAETTTGAAPSTNPRANSFEAFAARLPESLRNALTDIDAKSPAALVAEQDHAETPNQPPVEPPSSRPPSAWNIPPSR